MSPCLSHHPGGRYDNCHYLVYHGLLHDALISTRTVCLETQKGAAIIEPLPALPDAEPVRIQGAGVLLGGYLFCAPPANAPGPTVVLLHGYGGDASTMAEPARLLVQAGYHALALS